MTEPITPGRFHEAVGVEGWRVLFEGECAHLRAESVAAGVALVNAIGGLANEGNHHPDIDLRHDGVTVRLRTHDVAGLCERDVHLARRAWRQRASCTCPQTRPPYRRSKSRSTRSSAPRCSRSGAPYWDTGSRGPEDLVDPCGRGPSFWFQEMDAPRPQRNRIHIDISVPHDQAQARIAAAFTAGEATPGLDHVPGDTGQPVGPDHDGYPYVTYLVRSDHGRGCEGELERAGDRAQGCAGSVGDH